MSADICQKHQSQDTHEDPCLFCLLEFIRSKALQGKKLNEVKPLKEIMETIYQSSKNRLSQRIAVAGGKK
jgi:hypothetical protein